MCATFLIVWKKNLPFDRGLWICNDFALEGSSFSNHDDDWFDRHHEIGSALVRARSSFSHEDDRTLCPCRSIFVLCFAPEVFKHFRPSRTKAKFIVRTILNPKCPQKYCRGPTYVSVFYTKIFLNFWTRGVKRTPC